MKIDEQRISIKGIAGNLEAQLIKGFPNQENNSEIGIIICHPHPGYGGTMAFPVVRMLYKAFGNLGHPSLRFNFRGVGNSDGITGNGEGEREDLISVCNFLLNSEFGVKRILVIGYSFGATIAASVVSEFNEIIGYVAISYPFSFIPQFISHAKVNKPKFFIIGDRDDFTTLNVFQKEYKEMPEPKNIKIFPGVDHFWSGSENILTETIIDWFNKKFE
jgi:hypothetical protein